jgi:hypothetical protein
MQPEFDIEESSVFLQDAGKASTTISYTVSRGAPSLASENDCVLLNTLSTPAPDPDIVVLDSATTDASHDLTKKRRVYDLNWHFQDHWAAKMPWVELSLRPVDKSPKFAARSIRRLSTERSFWCRKLTTYTSMQGGGGHWPTSGR